MLEKPQFGSFPEPLPRNQILTEMDGFEGNSGVIVVAATNRADTRLHVCTAAVLFLSGFTPLENVLAPNNSKTM